MRKQELSGVVGLQTGAAGLESRVAASVTLQTRTPGVRGPLLASDRGDCPAGHGSAAEGRWVRAKRPRPAAWRPGAVGVETGCRRRAVARGQKHALGACTAINLKPDVE